MNYVKAGDILNILENEHIYSANGIIKMTLNDISVRVKQRDTIGNILQEWLGEFLKKNNIYFRSAVGQTFPDFYLSEEENTNLCEMKSFIAKNGPAFDIANFFGYIDSLRDHAYRLDSDYLIFSYTSSEEGVIKIDKIWCKKVWEITGSSREFPLNCQRKKGQIYNIRPVRWMSEKENIIKPFPSKEKFIAALYKTLLSTNNQVNVTRQWLSEVTDSYKVFSGEDMTNEIKKYL